VAVTTHLKTLKMEIHVGSIPSAFKRSEWFTAHSTCTSNKTTQQSADTCQISVKIIKFYTATPTKVAKKEWITFKMKRINPTTGGNTIGK
jgi:hypothetical protein